MPPKGAAAKRQTSNPASRRQASNPPKAKAAAAAPAASVAAPKAPAVGTSTGSRPAAAPSSAAAAAPKASPKASPKVKAAAARAAGTRGAGATASAAGSGAAEAASSASSASAAPAVPVATEEPENTSTLEASAAPVQPAASGSNQEPDAQQPQQSEDGKAAEKHAEEEGEQATSAAPYTSEATQAAVEAELRRLAALANGEVVIKYEMYNEKFPIENHRMKASIIDEGYCFSDIMPGCFIHLSDKEYVHGEERTYVKEDPPGTFVGLMAGETYWCVVEQDPEQEKRDQERMRRVWAGGVEGGAIGNRGSEGEACSCGWGAPCINPMVCKDWDNRFTNAIKAGGNPLLFNTTAS